MVGLSTTFLRKPQKFLEMYLSQSRSEMEEVSELRFGFDRNS